MKKMFALVLLGAMVAGCEATAQDAPTVIDAADTAMGTSSLQSIQYSGSGSVFMLGQNVRPEAPWPKFTVTKYSAGVRYDAPAFREELVRIDTDNPPRGGGAGGYSAETGQGGMRPIIGEQTQVRQGTPATDNGFLQVWMTPHGFLKAAAANKATLGNADGRRTLTFQGRNKATVTGTLNDENLVERIETRVDNPMLGDMLVEALYTDYKDYNGVKFPGRIVERSGWQPDARRQHQQRPAEWRRDARGPGKPTGRRGRPGGDLRAARRRYLDDYRRSQQRAGRVCRSSRRHRGARQRRAVARRDGRSEKARAE